MRGRRLNRLTNEPYCDILTHESGNVKHFFDNFWNFFESHIFVKIYIPSPVHSPKTPVRVYERKTKNEKMYACHGKTLAIFSAICYDEITLNSKENKVVYTKNAPALS